MEMSFRKLTEEERHKIIYVLNDFFNDFCSDESPESEYITEFDIKMKKKEDEFILYLLEDNSPYIIDNIMEMCENYLKEKNEPDSTGWTIFDIIIMYDMWLNNSVGWPVMYNPEWEEDKILKEKKVKRKNVKLNLCVRKTG